ncbi:MAG: Eco57I restriction-modification methylase domain-containing protein [Gemmataceae bacterium]|nr:Eco57I restriction-modification methylase domain-containing protein [Gemmataceae bacterium]
MSAPKPPGWRPTRPSGGGSSPYSGGIRSSAATVFAAGGLDVVLANPPYIRQGWITDKPYPKEHYRAYDGVADLYVYFYEPGLSLLKPGGRLGYVVTNKWMKAGYGENLRRLYADQAWVETVVDLGHNKEVFPDADVFPCILTARRPDATPPPESARVCVLPRELTRLYDPSAEVSERGATVPRARFGADPWTPEPPGVAALMDKLRANGVPLKEFLGLGPLRGVVTGCNEAFIVDGPTRDRLIAEHPSSEAVLKKYLRGQDIDRWWSEWARERPAPAPSSGSAKRHCSRGGSAGGAAGPSTRRGSGRRRCRPCRTRPRPRSSPGSGRSTRC